MQTQTVRTTVDLDTMLLKKLRAHAAVTGLSQKKVIYNAIMKHLSLEEERVAAEELWLRTRELAKKGKEGVDLVAALREDRNRSDN